MSTDGSPSPGKFNSAEKRAVHNALERKRRDHIKDMFTQLKDSVPHLAGEKSLPTKASRAQILKKACEYIQMMRRRNFTSAKELEELTQQVDRTKRQIAKLEAIKATKRYVETLPSLGPSADSSWPTTSSVYPDAQAATYSNPSNALPSLTAYQATSHAPTESVALKAENPVYHNEPLAAPNSSNSAPYYTSSPEEGRYHQLSASVPVGTPVGSGQQVANTLISVQGNTSAMTMFDLHSPHNAMFHVGSPFVQFAPSSGGNPVGWSVQQLLANNPNPPSSSLPTQNQPTSAT
ncbi:hypothetical protein RvY_17794 [Ramazzottius varieornatus]|uniref:BHLH domain-containing protein n=1 Tax=Ramazzottius varieornatus TaxID=947166 RepID=A0A1D1W728_RAMVA|nr:hypothetical protein RvY_17794 [Ramazzottius varieornatus]